jgi:shikimate dehydrogenase
VVATRCAVLGSPIGHSLSPVLHRTAYAEAGLDWSYDAVEVKEADLAGFLDGLGDDWRGLSLTMPLKRVVLPLLDVTSPTASLVGTANTVLFENGARWGDNTDVPGAVSAVRERYDGPLHTAEVIGGGATAASMLVALARLGVSRVSVVARDLARARETVDLAERVFGADNAVGRTPDGKSSEPVDVLVSTIPASVQSPAVEQRASLAKLVFDVVYDPWPTRLAGAALAGRVPFVSGLDLLVHQAALQFTLMTGLEAPLEAMRASGGAALA